MDRLRRIRERTDNDAGFSLVELLIAMLVFAIFLTILLSSITGIVRASTKVSVVASTSNGLLNVFQKFDRQVRYADAVNFPGTGSTGYIYVEFRVNKASSPNGVTTCTQWRLNTTTSSLQSRTWPEMANATATPWITMLPNVANDALPTYPFKLIPADSTFKNQQLVLTIDGGLAPIKGAAVSTTFVARNSLIGTTSNSQTQHVGVSDTPVCWSSLTSGARP
jgi:prepilin-type N-terminal cleavage/methylation domain-containing protein